MIAAQNFTRWNFIAFVLLVCYVTGASAMERFVNYSTWPVLSSVKEFPLYHSLFTRSALIVLVIPAFASIIPNIIMIRYRPDYIPAVAIWICLLLALLMIISSFLIQFPLESELDKGYSQHTVDRLIYTDFWMRKVPSWGRVLIVLWMLNEMIRRSDKFIDTKQPS
jgi:hypothetical protein